MKQMTTILVLCFCFIFFTHGVHGGRKTLSREEDLELDRQVRLLNKPAIKTIQTEHGDIFDCVDIYKQPALDHPLLKNHKIQMKPSFSLKKKNQESSANNEHLEIGLKDGGCPKGTVPIKRIEKEDLIRAKSAVRRYGGKKANNFAHFAITRLSGGGFHGAQANIGVYNPTVSEDQASQAAIWLSSGQPDVVNSIHAGWVVDPTLYKDNLTRTFSYWTADGYQKTGCYNTFCPGFVQTNAGLPMGLDIKSVSTYKGQQYHYKVMVLKEATTGKWWLMVGDDGTSVGYWPDTLFSSLASSAEVVDWGGAAYHQVYPASPPMGSGHFPSDGFGGACFFSQVQVNFVDGQGFLDPDESKIEQLSDRSGFYGVGGKAQGITEKGYAFFFGGPGGYE